MYVSVCMLFAAVMREAAFSSLEALSAAGTVITVGSSQPLTPNGTNLQEDLRNDAVTYFAKWKKRCRYLTSLTWLVTTNDAVGDQPAHICARVSAYNVSSSRSLRWKLFATWVEDTLSTPGCGCHARAAVGEREQKPQINFHNTTITGRCGSGNSSQWSFPRHGTAGSATSTFFIRSRG